MAIKQGYDTSIYVGGTSTSFSNEATTKLTANTVYQITDSTKRVIDPTQTVTVEVDPDGVSGYSAAGAHTVDYYGGIITFDSDQGANALVRVSGNYIPLLEVATARSTMHRIERDVLDSSVQDGTSWRTCILGLGKASGTLDLLDDGLTDYDPGAGSQVFSDYVQNDTTFLIRIGFDAASEYLFAWAGMRMIEQSSDVADLVQARVEWSSRINGEATGPGIVTDI